MIRDDKQKQRIAAHLTKAVAQARELKGDKYADIEALVNQVAVDVLKDTSDRPHFEEGRRQEPGEIIPEGKALPNWEPEHEISRSPVDDRLNEIGRETPPQGERDKGEDRER